MKSRLVLLATAAALVVNCPLALGQEWDNDGGGNIFCEPVPAPQSVNIGDGSTVNLSTLNVRGDQMPVADPTPPQAGSLGTFRTDVASATSQSWTMQRDVLEIGKVWNESIQLAFHVQSFEPRDDGQDRYSGLMLHNETRPDWSGMWIMNDGPPTGGRAFPDPLQTLNAVGYAGLGFIPAMRNTGLVDPRGPWSRFHLFHNVSGTRPLFAHRPQMRNGITLTGNSDHAYVGQWFDQGTDGSDPEVDDNSNLVFATSDDELTDGTAHHWDNMSFRFFSDLSGADGPASTVNGLEMMRIRPFRPAANDPIQGFVGIGDFLTATTGPEERLDVLDGRVRIRALANNTNPTRMVVADNSGVLFWQTIPTGGGGPCDWFMSGVGNDLSTAWNGNPCVPQGVANVGIGGATVPGTKLGVSENTPVTGVTDMGINVATEGDTESNVGLRATCNRLSTIFSTANTGVYAEARNAKETNGVYARAEINTTGLTPALVYGISSTSHATANVHSVYGQRTDALLRAQATSVAAGDYVTLKLDAGATTPYAFGVSGQCIGASGVTVTNPIHGVSGSVNASGATVPQVHGVHGMGRGSPIAIGVFGEAGNGTTSNISVYGAYQPTSTAGGPHWAGYFVGDVMALGGTYFGSDDALKINEEPLLFAGDIVDQLQPLSYEYDIASYPSMPLHDGVQYGLLAQDLEAVLPGLVKDVHHPAVLDSLGNVVTPSVEFKAVNYVGLVPFLIAAVKEQRAELEAMQQQLANCCAEGMAPQGEGTNGIGYIDNNLAPAATDVRALRPDELVVTPNPFTENPTISYRIGTSGRAQLRVSDANGRDLGLLFDTGVQAGEHTMVWNTAAVATGTYWLILTLDGTRITEQAVKVQ